MLGGAYQKSGLRVGSSPRDANESGCGACELTRNLPVSDAVRRRCLELQRRGRRPRGGRLLPAPSAESLSGNTEPMLIHVSHLRSPDGRRTLSSTALLQEDVTELLLLSVLLLQPVSSEAAEDEQGDEALHRGTDARSRYSGRGRCASRRCAAKAPLGILLSSCVLSRLGGGGGGGAGWREGALATTGSPGGFSTADSAHSAAHPRRAAGNRPVSCNLPTAPTPSRRSSCAPPTSTHASPTPNKHSQICRWWCWRWCSPLSAARLLQAE
ncbi:hypothetical protein EYF80_011004 [Liparis tanakae]|uniref:Uncharacterized protein n=1 Tax=Liparis tanakae TaxID=230148 RepID=A0A4Z2IMX6_9TELE|nr:hypothetical protein EYF80_011004 [Liparis tanakae]